MKVYVFFLLLFLGTVTQSLCGVVVCGIPSRLDENTYVVTGRIIDHEEVSYRDRYEDRIIRAAVINVKVVKRYYSEEKIERVRLVLYNYSVEYIQETYKPGTIISFHGVSYPAIPGDERSFIGIGGCNPILKGYAWMKKRYNFERQRIAQSKIRTEIRLVKNDSLLGGHEKNMLTERLRGKLYKLSQKNSVGNVFQAYLLLIKLTKTNNEKKKIKILRKLIWSNLIMKENYFEDLDISDSMKATLISEWKLIREEWPLF